MLLTVSIILAAIACALLLFFSQIGVAAIFLARPLIDTAWEQHIFLGFKLTELVSVGVPILTAALLITNIGTKRALAMMPLNKFWLVYLFYILFFSINIGISSSIADGANIFFRFTNGFVGFYLVQAYFHDRNHINNFFIALALAGIFPVATGLYETLTGIHWKVTTAEGHIRSIGLYHDAITIRYYGLQTILAVAACFALNVTQSKILKLAFLGILAGALVIVFNALSKSGLLTVMLWMAIWIYYRQSWKLLLSIPAALIFLVPVYFQEILDLAYTIFHKEIGALTGEIDSERTFAGRWLLWERMYHDFVNFNSFQQIFGSGQLTLYAHNDYLQMLFHGGIVGLIVYVSFLAYVGRRAFTGFIKRSTFHTLALMLLVMWLIDAIGLVPSLYTGYQWLVWGVIGLAFRQENILSSLSPTKKDNLSEQKTLTTKARFRFV